MRKFALCHLGGERKNSIYEPWVKLCIAFTVSWCLGVDISFVPRNSELQGRRNSGAAKGRETQVVTAMCRVRVEIIRLNRMMFF